MVASPLGLDAVLSHIIPDGQDRPIAYASQILIAAERGSSQIEKEGLAVCCNKTSQLFVWLIIHDWNCCQTIMLYI